MELRQLSGVNALAGSGNRCPPPSPRSSEWSGNDAGTATGMRILVGDARGTVARKRNLAGGNREMVSRNRKTVGDNRETVAGNRNAVGVNREMVAGSRNAVGVNRETVTGNRNAVGVNRETVTGNRKTVDDDREMAAAAGIRSPGRRSVPGKPTRRSVRKPPGAFRLTSFAVESPGLRHPFRRPERNRPPEGGLRFSPMARGQLAGTSSAWRRDLVQRSASSLRASSSPCEALATLMWL